MEKRLFIGIKIEPSSELIHLISNLQKNFNDSEIRWIETNNLHLTLKFLGDVKNSLILEILQKLKSISQSLTLFDAHLIGLGKFSQNRQTNVIWIGYNDEGQLAKMAEIISESMAKMGFGREKRPFKAHLTLGRVTKCNEKILDSCIESYLKKTIQVLKIDHLILYESVLKPTGPIYKIIEQIHLNPPLNPSIL